VGVTVKTTNIYASGVRPGVIARATDNSNFVAAYWGATGDQLVVEKVVAGTVTTLGWADLSAPSVSVNHSITLTVRASGAWSATFNDTATASGTDSALATGGTLASGKSGIIDHCWSGVADTRTYSNFTVSTPGADATAVYQSQDLRFRQNEILREASGGDVYGTPFQNSQPFQPELTPEGSEGLTNRLLLGSSRFNPDLASAPHPDAFTATVLHTPVYVLGRDES
jgi:hypothetical protein